MIINSKGYLARRAGKGVYRDWFFIKYKSASNGYVCLNDVYFPEEMVGKRVRFRLELIDDEPVVDPVERVL